MEKIKSFIKYLTEEKDAIKAVDVIKEKLDELAKEQVEVIESEVYTELGFKSIHEEKKDEEESDDIDDESEEEEDDDEDDEEDEDVEDEKDDD